MPPKVPRPSAIELSYGYGKNGCGIVDASKVDGYVVNRKESADLSRRLYRGLSEQLLVIVGQFMVHGVGARCAIHTVVGTIDWLLSERWTRDQRGHNRSREHKRYATRPRLAFSNELRYQSAPVFIASQYTVIPTAPSGGDMQYPNPYLLLPSGTTETEKLRLPLTLLRPTPVLRSACSSAMNPAATIASTTA